MINHRLQKDDYKWAQLNNCQNYWIIQLSSKMINILYNFYNDWTKTLLTKFHILMSHGKENLLLGFVYNSIKKTS